MAARPVTMGQGAGRLSRGSPRLAFYFAVVATVILGSVAPAPAQPSAAAPEGSSAWQDKTLVQAKRQMVVAANPYATAAGLDILRAGGSAVDAAITVQLVLGLVEPQSSGLGGGAFALVWDAAARQMKSYDGRETAPAAAKSDRFRKDGRALPFKDAVRSGLSVGVPGIVRLIEHVHRRHGKLPWPRLFDRAIALAEAGFTVSPRLHALLQAEGAQAFPSDARTYFFGQGSGDSAPRPGAVLKNPNYGATLRAIAAGGSAAFYQGAIAREIVTAVAAAPVAAGDLTLADIAGYKVEERPPLCVEYRAQKVCGMGPPSSGAIAVGQALMLLDGFDLGRTPGAAMQPGPTHLIVEALKLAFADRNWYVADPAFASVPTGLTDPAYIAERRALIDPWTTMARPYPGIPPGRPKVALGEDETHEAAGTSHISIVDAAGNAVSMTTTIEAGFGSRLWAAGFLLNNELTDFSFRARDAAGNLIANRIEGGKRPRSSMAPTIVLDDAGSPWLVTGSPGGSRIIGYVLKTLVAMIDWKLDAQAAAALPNFGARAANLELEHPMTWSRHPVGGPQPWGRTMKLMLGLKPLGSTLDLEMMTSGSHTIRRRPDGTLEGGADPRREGLAAGD